MKNKETKEGPKSPSELAKEYRGRNYSRIEVMVLKDKKPELKALADAAGVSLNRYILQAVEKASGLSLTLDNELPQIRRAREEKPPADPVQDDGTGDQ